MKMACSCSTFFKALQKQSLIIFLIKLCEEWAQEFNAEEEFPDMPEAE